MVRLNKNKINDRAEAIGNLYEEMIAKLQTLSSSFLYKNQDKRDYITRQYASIPQYNKATIKVAQNYLKYINKMFEVSLIMQFNEMQNLPITINKETKTISVGQLPANLDFKLKKIAEDNMKLVAQSVQQVQNDHIHRIEQIQFRLGQMDEGENWQELNKNERTQKVFDSISETIEKYGGVKNTPKVEYSNGSKYSYKSYAEMNARTTMNIENTEQMLEVSRNSQVIFFVCSFMSDSAPDHADLQGRYYYDNNYPSYGLDEETLKKVDDYISSHKLMSIQDVVSAPYYLTTRPNCRHDLQAVPTSEVIDDNISSMEQAKSMRMSKNGDYNEEKYEALQTQRYDERKIREWKSRLEEHQNSLDNSVRGTDTSAIEKLIAKDKAKIREWQKATRELVNENQSFLERDYNREDINVISHDLGYKFSKRG